MTDLKDKVVIITGSSSGIGAETAVKFAECGAKVVITGRNQSGIDETVDRCKQAGANDLQILSICGDLTESDVISRLVDDTVRAFGAIHVLVNNAGAIKMKHNSLISKDGQDESADSAGMMTDFVETTADDLLFHYNINLVTAFNLTQRAMPHLVKTKGSVVNVSSITGSRAVPGSFSYSLSKAAMNHMTKILAVEFAPKGVRVNGVIPGAVVTPVYTRPDGLAIDNPEQFYQMLAGLYPVGRIGQSPEVAAAILFLASEQSSFVTGVLMHVDGGIHQTIRG